MAEVVQLDTRIPLAGRQFPGVPVGQQLLALAQIRSGRAHERLQGALLQKALQEQAQRQRGEQALQNPLGFLASRRDQGLAEISRAGQDPLAQARDVTPQTSPELAAGTIVPTLQQGGPPLDPAAAQGQPGAQQPQRKPMTQLEAMRDPDFPAALFSAGLFDTAKRAADFQQGESIKRAKDLANAQESISFAGQLIAPIAASSASLAEKDRQYQLIKGRFAQELDSLGISEDRVMPTWNQADAELLIAQGKDSAQTLAEATETNRVEQERLKAFQETLKTKKTQDKLTFDQANVLRDDFTRQSGNFRALQQGVSLMRASAANPSPAGDIALIFGFMKLVDPVSTVREGEFATVQNAGGIDERTRNLYNQLLSGTRLGAAGSKIRADFLDRGERIFAPRVEQHRRLEETFRGMAKRAGVDPRDVLTSVPLTGGPSRTGREKGLSSAVDSVRNP